MILPHEYHFNLFFQFLTKFNMKTGRRKTVWRTLCVVVILTPTLFLLKIISTCSPRSPTPLTHSAESEKVLSEGEFYVLKNVWVLWTVWFDCKMFNTQNTCFWFLLFFLDFETWNTHPGIWKPWFVFCFVLCFQTWGQGLSCRYFSDWRKFDLMKK